MIALEIGVSRCAVAGKVHRLKAQLVLDLPEPDEPEDDIPAFGFAGSALMARPLYGCAWPLGSPIEKGFRYCCEARHPKKPYCVEHLALRNGTGTPSERRAVKDAAKVD